MIKLLNQKLNTYTIIIVIFVICGLLDVILGVERGSQYRNDRLVIQGVYTFALGFMIFTLLMNGLIGIKNNVIKNYYGLLSLLIVYGIFAFIINPHYSLYELGNLVKFALWLVSIPFFYSGFTKGLISNNIIKLYLLSNIIFSSALVIQSLSVYKEEDLIMGANQAYNLLFLLPLVFIFFKGNIKLILFFCISIVILLSMKRGPIILLSIVSLYSFNNLRRESKPIFLIILGSIFIFAVFQFWENYSEAFLYRFSELIYGSKYNEGTYGSGRSTFYSLVFWGWLDSNIFNFIFGNGFFSVPDFLKLTYGRRIVAHNDWLEIAFSFGIIGLLLYIKTVYYLIRNYFKQFPNIEIKRNYFIFLIIFIGTSIFSHTFYSAYTIFISLSIAYFSSLRINLN